MYLEMLWDNFNRVEVDSLMTKSAVANKAFRRLAKKYITPYYRNLTREVPAGIRYSDLNIPLKERIAGKFNSSVNSLSEPYEDYLARVWKKDPGIDRRNALSAKIIRASEIRSHLSAQPNGAKADQLIQYIASDGAEPFLAKALQGRVIPRLTLYKSKTPYATTHHLADGKLSLAANKAARNAQPGELLIANPNTKAGWKNYRGQEFRVNTPGTPWSPEELELMRTSSNLSDTNLYETVFSRANRNFPNAIATYVPDTPEIRQALALKPDVKGVSIDDLQSKVQGTLYRGTPIDKYPILNAFNSYRNAVHHYVPDRLKKNTDLLWTPILGDQTGIPTGAPERWFAPASRTGMGYARATDSQKFIRLDSDALRRLRELNHLDVAPASIRELEGYTDADWTNMFRALYQKRRLNNILEQLANQRENTMDSNLYRVARIFGAMRAS